MRRWRALALFIGLAAIGCSGPGKSAPQAEYRSVTWKELANFAYEPSVRPEQPRAAKTRPIPEAVRCLNGQRLRLSGYMMPIEVEGRKVLTFVLVRDQQMCCYGKTPAMNEWVFVRLDRGRSIDMQMDKPIEVDGSFEVGEDIQEGVVISLYRMVADSVNLAEGKPVGWKAN